MDWEKYIKALRRAIENEEDEAKLKELNEDLDKAIADQAAEKAKAEADDELKTLKGELDLLKAKAKAGGYIVGDKVEITEVGAYKGFNLKAEKAMIIADPRTPETVKDLFKSDPERGERMAKFWVDLVERAMSNPMQSAAVVRAAQAEGTDALGGYLTPPEQRADLLYYIREKSVAMGLCTHMQMHSDTMDVNSENVKVNVGWNSEAAQATETSATFNQTRLTANRLDAYVKVNNELLQDALVSGGLVADLMSQFTEAVGLKIDSTVFQGTGSPFSGIFTNNGISQVFSTGSTHFSALLESDLRGILAQIKPQWLNRFKWVMNHYVLWDIVGSIKDNYGAYRFIDNQRGGPLQVLGYPVALATQAPGAAADAAGTGFIVGGDLSGVIIGDRLTNITLFTDPYTNSLNYQTLFLLFTRWGFADVLPDYRGRIVTSAT